MANNMLIIRLLRVVGDLASTIQDLLELHGKNIQHLKSTEFEATCEKLSGIETKLDLVNDELNIIQIKLIEEN